MYLLMIQKVKWQTYLICVWQNLHNLLLYNELCVWQLEKGGVWKLSDASGWLFFKLNSLTWGYLICEKGLQGSL